MAVIFYYIYRSCYAERKVTAESKQKLGWRVRNGQTEEKKTHGGKEEETTTLSEKKEEGRNVSEQRENNVYTIQKFIQLGDCLFAEHTLDTPTNYDSFLNF